MAFRIGKSVLLYFGSTLEPVFIFTGLAFLLLIGPLLRWYILAMTDATFKISRVHMLEFVPFALVFLLGFFVAEDEFDPNNKEVVIVFGSTLISIYLHFASYIFISGRVLKKKKNQHKKIIQTKFQKVIFTWLSLLIFGFIIIWISYFLNIIENTVPYIVGPIMYSLAIYFLSYKAFTLKVTDLDGQLFIKNDDVTLFHEISRIIIKEKRYLEPNFSLSDLGKLIEKSPQKTSEIINQYGNRNFNDFINFQRIQEAKKLLLDIENDKYTISSIAFDIGFNSLSSFNGAFKKFEGTTPSKFRKFKD